MGLQALQCPWVNPQGSGAGAALLAREWHQTGRQSHHSEGLQWLEEWASRNLRVFRCKALELRQTQPLQQHGLISSWAPWGAFWVKGLQKG